MKIQSKVAAAVALAAISLSLTACGPAAVNHAAAACDGYDAVVEQMNGSDSDALISANAAFVATLAVWQSEGGEPADLYEKLSGYAGALEGFILSATPENAKIFTDFQAAEASNIESLCTDARG